MPTWSSSASACRGMPRRRGASSGRSRRWCESSAICTFSRTVIEAKVAVIWKVRPTPSRQIAARRQAGDVPAVQPDAGRASGASWPFSMLKQVVLPAPFGPISASISPARRRRRRRAPPARRRRLLLQACDLKRSPCATPRAAASAARPPTRPCGKNSTSSDDRRCRASAARTRSARTSCSLQPGDRRSAPTIGPVSVWTPPSSTITSASTDCAGCRGRSGRRCPWHRRRGRRRGPARRAGQREGQPLDAEGVDADRLGAQRASRPARSA